MVKGIIALARARIRFSETRKMVMIDGECVVEERTLSCIGRAIAVLHHTAPDSHGVRRIDLEAGVAGVDTGGTFSHRRTPVRCRLSRLLLPPMRIPLLVVSLVIGSVPLYAQSPARRGYPIKPTLLPEREEIALARSAAPAEVADRADIYVLRAHGLEKVVNGTNGCACFVSRDLHEGSRYPICYDQEAVRTSMPREMMEISLRMAGHDEGEIKRLVAAAYENGTLIAPSKPSLIYMMSPRQVLFSSPGPEGVRVGAWHPHVMIPMPYATARQFGLQHPSKVDGIAIDNEGQVNAQLIVIAPTWADSAVVRRHP